MTASQAQISSNTKSATRPPIANSNSNQASSTNNYHQNQATSNNLPSNVISCSSAAFQQVKQTQASLARLSRHGHHNQNQGQFNHSSQSQVQIQQSRHQAASQETSNSVVNQTGQIKLTTFVDCLIRRFKDCFSEDCSVPMFVVGNLSPGSDGNHLILPPCVSLDSQNISRFSTPKNLRLMNSIRESCRSIEELDLGRNRLTDLIEIYKILQCCPNLKFLNLSENDLSKAAPVAMAANYPTASIGSTTTTTTAIWPSSSSNILFGSSAAPNARTCLAQINQNHQVPGSIGCKRHSTLGTSSLKPGPMGSRGPSRVAEARRLAATAAVAQSKKTSSSIASKLTSSARVSGNGSLIMAKDIALSGSSTGTNSSISRSASTMHLARSLSSLSAKNMVRPLSGIGRKGSDLRQSAYRAETKQLTGINYYKTGPLSTVTGHQHNQQNLPFKRFTFESIKALALNNTGCQWRVVCSIVSRMPNLEELHLSLNNYEKIDLDPNQDFRHNSLKRLYLCNNPKLTDWQELTKLLIAFPSLEALSIADCNISQIPENLSQAREWRKLCGLNITGWPIKEWPVIERLNQLPSLIDLRCRNLELLNTIDAPRDHLIARLPRLQRLNGSEIQERDQAEKAFLRFFVTNSHLERPTRFHELTRIHGSVDAQVDIDVDLSPPSRANVRVVYLNRNFYRETNQDDILMSEDFLTKLMDNIDTEVVQQQNENQDDSLDSDMAAKTVSKDDEKSDCKLIRLFKDENQEVLSIEVDLRQSVRKFKQTLATSFGLNSQDMILYYIDREMVGLMGPELIKHNQKKLWNYNVQDGDQFIVEER